MACVGSQQTSSAGGAFGGLLADVIPGTFDGIAV